MRVGVLLERGLEASVFFFLTLASNPLTNSDPTTTSRRSFSFEFSSPAAQASSVPTFAKFCYKMGLRSSVSMISLVEILESTGLP